MVDLDELKRLAEGATPGPWFINTEAEYCGARIDGPDGRSIGHAIQRNPHPTLGQGITQEEAMANARLIAAMSPDTAKKLIAVALAAQAYVNDELDFAPNDGKRWAALRAALEELK